MIKYYILAYKKYFQIEPQIPEISALSQYNCICGYFQISTAEFPEQLNGAEFCIYFNLSGSYQKDPNYLNTYICNEVNITTDLRLLSRR